MFLPADLPDDITTLKALIAERNAALTERNVSLAEQDTVVNELREQLSTRTVEIEHLKLWIAKLHRIQFGRNAEKLDSQIGQLNMRLDDLQAGEGRSASAAQRANRRFCTSQRKPLPPHLPCDELVHFPCEQACAS
jgi:transposase